MSERVAVTLARCSEPLTAAATPEHDDESNWAQCDAYRVLRSQIERYARGEILGQSMLLAGHRGSGKTTLVHLAIQQVGWMAEEKAVLPETLMLELEGAWDPSSHCRIAGWRALDGLRHGTISADFRNTGTGRELVLVGIEPLLAENRLSLREHGSEAGELVFRREFPGRKFPGSDGARDRATEVEGTLTGRVLAATKEQSSEEPSILWRGDIQVKISLGWDGDGAAEVRMPKLPFGMVGRLRIDGELTITSKRPFAAIPFLVPLHGPDLFLARCEPGDEDRSFAEQAMAQIRKAVHRALAEEIGKRFCMHASELKHRDLASKDLVEAATQLRIELDQAPPLSMLRMYWDKAGLLETGLLGSFRRRAGRITRSKGNARDSQGYKEILALFTAIDAETVRPRDKRSAEETKPAAETAEKGLPSAGHGIVPGIEEHLKTPDRMQDAVRLAAPVLSLLAGAFAAHAVIEVLGPLTAGAIAIITVLLSYSFLRRTIPSRPDATLTGDASVDSQDLLLPVLVERSIDAGFAPIFVVDELDKVKGDLDHKLDVLMKRLKHFVTDRAFFCFIADRSYYEQFQHDIRHRPYPVQDTYYADRLLIYYGHKELHAYLHKTLKSRSSEIESEPLMEMLPYLILSQSNAHVGALSRVLKEHSERERLRFDEGSGSLWTVAGYRLATVIQVAIECICEDPIVATRLRQEPHFTQWLQDALYHFLREWRDDVRVVQYTRGDAIPARESAPIAYFLEGRIAVTSASEKSSFPALASLDERDKDFLYFWMERLAAYLAEPQQLALKMLARKEAARWPRSIQLLVLQSMPLVTACPIADIRRYAWVFDQYGREITGDPTPQPGSTEWLRAVSEDSESGKIFEARVTLLDSLDNLTRKIDIGNGMQGLLRALHASRKAEDNDYWQILDGWDGANDAYLWRQWRPRNSAFATLQGKETFDRAVPGMRRLAALECLLRRRWPNAFPLLEVALIRRRKGSSWTDLEILAKEQKASDLNPNDWAINQGANYKDPKRIEYAQRLTAAALEFLGK